MNWQLGTVQQKQTARAMLLARAGNWYHKT
jgi:hypothetical protein